MGIEVTSKTIVKPSKTCKSGIDVETRLHKNSGLVYRENFGSSDTGASFENDGLDLCVIGEDDDDVEIFDQPECGCKNSGLRSGSKRMRDQAGKVRRYFEPAPRSWCEESSSYSSAGDGPVGSSGDRILVNGVNLKVNSRCYPLVVRFYLEVCDWYYFPENPEIVRDIIDFEVFETVGDGEQKSLLTKRCSTGGSDKRLGCFEMQPESELEINLNAGYQYFEEVKKSFKSNIGDLKIVADVYELTSFDSIQVEGC